MLTPGGSMGGRYRLDERIATGGMGDVWKAEDTVLGRAVALKVLQPAMLEEPGFAERFRAEARVMATVNHPGVVQVYDYGENQLDGGGSVAYLVMEYVEGEPLHRVLARVGRLAPTRVMDLTSQAAEALQAAHDRGIVHRDVKPGNLLVRPDGKLVLTDFGIARSALTGNLTQAGAVLGTASYVSPEQATGSGDITPASDVYSLGVVAYQCLAGHRPFEGDNPIEVAMRHIREEPPPLPPDVPEAARAVVGRAMAKDVAARWPDARAMSDAARAAAEGRPVPGAGAATAVLGAGSAGTAVLPGAAAAAPSGPAPTGQFVRGAATVPAAGQADEDAYYPGDHHTGRPRKRRGPLVLGLTAALLAVLLGIGLVAWLAGQDDNTTPGAGESAPPSPTAEMVTIDTGAYLGKPVDDVVADLKALGLTEVSKKERDTDGEYQAGQVNDVNPDGPVKKTQPVVVYYEPQSTGGGMPSMPGLPGGDDNDDGGEDGPDDQPTRTTEPTPSEDESTETSPGTSDTPASPTKTGDVGGGFGGSAGDDAQRDGWG